MHKDPDFINALRPFSLIVAIATCGLGVSLALLEGSDEYILGGLVVFTGVLLQIAVNLVNDFGDIDRPGFSVRQQQTIRSNYRLGVVSLGVAVALGLYMVSIRGWPLLLLGLLGVIGAWGYTGGRLNYKARGLGVALVFLLMGVMMIGGAYFVVSGQYGWDIFWLSIPFSLLSSLLLLSNELRDFEEDKNAGIRTLSVRMGYRQGRWLYAALIASLYLATVLLYLSGMLRGVAFLLLTMIAAWAPIRLLDAAHEQRKVLTELTGRFYLVFSAVFLATLWGPLP